MSLDKAEAELGVIARAVVLKRTAIATAVPVVVDALVSLGVPLGVTDGLAKAIAFGLTVAGVVAGAAWSHKGATPANMLLGPRSSTGKPLVEASVAVAALVPDKAEAELRALDVAAAATLNPPAGGSVHPTDAVLPADLK